MLEQVLFGCLSDGEHIGAVRARKAESALVCLVRLCHETTVPTLEHYDVRNGTIMAAVSWTRYASVYLLLNQVSLALTTDTELRLVGFRTMDSIHARHRVWVHSYNLDLQYRNINLIFVYISGAAIHISYTLLLWYFYKNQHLYIRCWPYIQCWKCERSTKFCFSFIRNMVNCFDSTSDNCTYLNYWWIF